MKTVLTAVQSLGRWETWPEGHVYIGMPGPAARAAGIADEVVGPFGKPWACLKDSRGWQAAYREYLWHRLKAEPEFASAVKALAGSTLVCWCTAKAERRGKPVACHGTTLIRAIEWLNQPSNEC